MEYLLECPHCNISISVLKTQLNCQIFRCGIFKHNYQPIPPHSPKIKCDQWFEKGLIYGCGKPFKFDGKKTSICDYI